MPLPNSRGTKLRFFRRFVAVAAWAIVAWVGTANLSGIILFRTGDPLANTTEPTGDLAGSGWQFEGLFGTVMGTPIAPHYFLTAKHAGYQSSAFIFQGHAYTVLGGFNDPNSDLAIWQVVDAFPVTAPLYPRGDEIGKPLVVIGRGTQRGAGIFIDSTLKGWAWGGYDGMPRWGENTVAEIRSLGLMFGDALYATFDAGGGFNEAHLSSGDSGGGVFIRDTDGLWKLAGISADVDGPFYSDAAGSNAFTAALFDLRGFYVPNPTPPVFKLVTGDDPVPSGFYASRISTKLLWIDSVIDPLGDINADGVRNLPAYALGIDPARPNAGQFPRVTVDGSDLSLIYTRELTATDTTCTVERSPDLLSWSPASPANEIVSTVGTIQTIKAKVPRGEATQMFLRLRVTRP